MAVSFLMIRSVLGFAVIVFVATWAVIGEMSQSKTLRVSCAHNAIECLIRKNATVTMKAQVPRQIHVPLRTSVLKRFESLANDIVHVNQNVLLLRELLSEIWLNKSGLKDINIDYSERLSNFSFLICLINEHSLVLPGGRSLDPLTPIGNVPSLRGKNEFYHVRNLDCDVKKYDVIVEYSMPNYVNYETSGIFSNEDMQKFVYVPSLPYDIQIDIGKKKSLKPFTTFVNPDEPRRRQFLDRMELEGVSIENVNDRLGASSMMQVYDVHGIMLNIRQTDHHHTLEEFRVLPALTRGVIVISEDVPLRESVPYHKFIVWCTLDNFSSTVYNVINHYTEYFDSIFGPKSDLVDTILSMRSTANHALQNRIQFLANTKQVQV